MGAIVSYEIAGRDGRGTAVAAARQGRRGYTILELVLVLAILAMALAAVAPSLSGFIAGRKAEEAAARFLALTHYARSQAVTDGLEYELVVDSKEGKWWLRTLDGEETQEVDGAFGKVFEAPEGVAVESDIAASEGEQVIRFDPSGRSGVGTVRFVGVQNEVAVVCDAPLQGFRVLQADDEVRR